MSTIVATDVTKAAPDNFILSYTRVSLEITTLQTLLKNISFHLDSNSAFLTLPHQLEPGTETSRHM